MLLLWLIKLLFTQPINFLIAVVVMIIPLFISITIHEWAHGFVAYKFGDPTPKIQGRLSFNPFAHLDLIGTLMLFVVGVGWAKPVQININNIPSKTKQLIIAMAGPFSNFTIAVIFSIIIVLLNHNIDTINKLSMNNDFTGVMFTLLSFVIKINLILTIFNLMPIPPLDGSSIIRWLLPDSLMEIYNKISGFGFVAILLIFYFLGFSFIYKFAEKTEFLILATIYKLIKIFI